jgi:hypothetical protein
MQHRVPAIDGYAKMTVGYEMDLQGQKISYTLGDGIPLTDDAGIKILPS